METIRPGHIPDGGPAEKTAQRGSQPGEARGILVYAVCSGEPEENEQVVTDFLKKRKDYALDPICNCQGLPMDRYLKTFPNGMNMDGFFAARMKRS
jgi:16S rRNA (cytosine967-C5)-methyltransferase